MISWSHGSDSLERSPTWTRSYKRDPNLRASLFYGLYHKPTDVHPLLHSMSHHPSHTTHNIAFAQAQRYRKICSQPAEYERQIHFLEDIFIKRGYLLGDIRRHISRASSRSREELLTGHAPHRESGTTRPIFTTVLPPTHGPDWRYFTQRLGHLSKPDLHQVFRERPMIAFRRGMKLRDLLVMQF